MNYTKNNIRTTQIQTNVEECHNQYFTKKNVNKRGMDSQLNKIKSGYFLWQVSLVDCCGLAGGVDALLATLAEDFKWETE